MTDTEIARPLELELQKLPSVLLCYVDSLGSGSAQRVEK